MFQFSLKINTSKSHNFWHQLRLHTHLMYSVLVLAY